MVHRIRSGAGLQLCGGDDGALLSFKLCRELQLAAQCQTSCLSSFLKWVCFSFLGEVEGVFICFS